MPANAKANVVDEHFITLGPNREVQEQLDSATVNDLIKAD